MIKTLTVLTPNAKKVCIADFFWNLGRTLPHAILTVFLLYKGCTLTEIALLQSIFMVVSLLTEFPSGVWADIFSRKFIYLLSLVTLFIAYLLIGFFSDSFTILCISYVLYGLSVSLKSGTLDAEVVLELSDSQENIKKYSVITSYIMSISSIIGGLIGSFLYGFINDKIYIIALILFSFSFVSASLCSFNTNKKYEKKGKTSLIEEVKRGLDIVKKSNILKCILGLFAVSTLFLQPFFQYWQVFYQNNNISPKYFGVIYVLFQVCNILGTALYKKINFKPSTPIVILTLIPIVYGIANITKWSALISLPLAVIIFFVYSMHLDVIQKQNAPKDSISSFFSLVGTIGNIFSVISLFIMAISIKYFDIKFAYLIVFVIFSALAVIFESKLKRLINNTASKDETENR